MLTYDRANVTLGTRQGRKVANNTYLERLDGNTIGLRLHSTYVVVLTPEWFELSSGGWFTVTTKDRLNYAACVFQKDGLWFVATRCKQHPEGFNVPDWDNAIPYFDGMRLSYSGELLNAPETAHASIGGLFGYVR